MNKEKNKMRYERYDVDNNDIIGKLCIHKDCKKRTSKPYEFKKTYCYNEYLLENSWKGIFKDPIYLIDKDLEIWAEYLEKIFSKLEP